MINFIQDGSSMFDKQYDALVNPVNCKGVMGKGLALEFKERFPMNYKLYRDICYQNKLSPGSLYWVYDFLSGQIIVNFATKDHWKDPSKLEWIEAGCDKLREFLIDDGKRHEIKTIAIPKLGCGLGGLNWNDVRYLMLKSLESVYNVDIYIYGEI